MRVLVTGGAGFIGSNMVELLLKKENDVVVIDNLHTGSLENLKEFKDRVEFLNKKLWRNNIKRYWGNRWYIPPRNIFLFSNV